MLEGTEMGALSESRLGNKCFIDDNEYANLFGSRKAKRNEAKRTAELNEQFRIPADKEKDCAWLNGKLVEANNQLQAAYEKGLQKRLEKRETRPIIDAIARIKTFLTNAKCEETQLAKEAEATTQRALEEVNKASLTLPPDQLAGAETGAPTTSNTTKYILYGVGGLVLVGVLIAIIKRNK